MNKCDQSWRLSAYMDRELGADDMTAMERHVAQCPVCAGVLGEFRSVTAQLHGAAKPAFSADGMTRLHRQVDEWNRRGAERFAGVLSAMAACLAIVSALSLMRASQAVPAPLPWEAAAARITDDASGGNNKENVVAEWMVADVSHGGADGE